MFDHFGFVVRNLSESLRFYEASLAPLGLKIVERHDDEAVIISGEKEFSFIWMGTTTPGFWRQEHSAGRSPFHLAFSAQSREAVEAFYEAGLENGGKDNGGLGREGTTTTRLICSIQTVTTSKPGRASLSKASPSVTLPVFYEVMDNFSDLVQIEPATEVSLGHRTLEETAYA